jgi:hypothetical protein
VDLGVLDEFETAGLVVLADKGYQGAAHAKIPYKGYGPGVFVVCG